MKTYISAWPVDRKEQEKLGIYNHGYVSTQAVGGILHRLAKLGYTIINSYVDSDSKGGKPSRIVFHCSKNFRDV